MRSAVNDWRGGAALHVDTGMNRLGLSVEEAERLAPRSQTESHGLALLMSHLACAETPDHPLNDRQIRLFREIRMIYRGVPVLARQFVRHLPRRHASTATWSAPASRSTAPIRRPASKTHAAGGRAQGPRPPGPHVKRGETVGYGATWTPRGATPHRDRRGRLCGRLHALRRAPPRAARRPSHRRGQALSARRPRLHGSVAVDVTDLPRSAPRRGDFATLIGDGHERRRVAGACRHDRLRGAHQPRPALPPDLQGRDRPDERPRC